VSKRVKKSKRTRVIIASFTAIIVCSAAVLGFGKIFGSKTAGSDSVINLDTVTRGDIEVKITSQASVEPYERYEIISMVSGDILNSPYDVGDEVSKGDILYQFDTSSQEINIKKQELSVQQSKNNLKYAKSDLADAQEKLSVTAPNSGIISGLDIKSGNSILSNQILAQIENTTDLEVSLPFTKGQIDAMYIGQAATVSSSSHMSTVEGKVSSISSNPIAQSDGSNVYNVTISFKNPGAFTSGLTVGGAVGTMQSPGFGTVKTVEAGTAKAEASGTIISVNYSNGDYVEKGAVIATIDSDSLTSQQRSIENSELSLKNAELSMQETRDLLDDYSITSPISGTVITKNAKAGDTIDKTNSSTTLMVVADISRLKFTLEIDELDITSVTEGQRVDITCDAIPGETFVGEITGVSVEGVATNGVTTYTADVVINEPGNLRPSMSIDASVIINSVSNVLKVPSADIKTAMGVSYVFLKDETGTRGATEEDFMSAMRGDAPDIKKPNGTSDEWKENKKNSTSRLPEAPDGFVIAIVKTGITDDEYTEIISGLLEGDQIQQLSLSSATSTNMMMGGMPNGMMGGMQGGAMSSGGGMPGGTMR